MSWRYDSLIRASRWRSNETIASVVSNSSRSDRTPACSSQSPASCRLSSISCQKRSTSMPPDPFLCGACTVAGLLRHAGALPRDEMGRPLGDLCGAQRAAVQVEVGVGAGVRQARLLRVVERGGPLVAAAGADR